MKHNNVDIPSPPTLSDTAFGKDPTSWKHQYYNNRLQCKTN